jgi:methylated-DNA-[protein]-cysteine S-methyltransferase
MNETLWTSTHESPIGTLRSAVGSDGALVALGFEDSWAPLFARVAVRFADPRVARGVPEHVTQAIEAYFGGDVTALDALPVDPAGTEFQRRVWTALRAIPAGETRSYAAVASMIGAPRAVRAVGAANRANPVAIAIPCHRVIASDGALHGYGGGLERKRWLLGHERAASGQGMRQTPMPLQPMNVGVGQSASLVQSFVQKSPLTA